MIVERYRDEWSGDWDAFVRASRNGTFLFERGYMDYHRDRFTDHSLVIRGESEIVALLPAHAIEDRVLSHGGLSHGGLIVGPRMKLPTMLEMFEALTVHLRDRGFQSLDYKTIPHIYHRQPTEEDRYALHVLGAQVTRRDALSVVPFDERLEFQHRRERSIKKARAAGVEVSEEPNLAEFWKLLESTLAERHEARPVHLLEEITRLKERFPANIRLFTARASELLAGVVIYESERVAHCQYIAASPAGRAIGALDRLFEELLERDYRTKPYFDFGSSHTTSPAINLGLIDQKEGFGARTVVHDHYRIDLTAIEPGRLTGALR